MSVRKFVLVCLGYILKSYLLLHALVQYLTRQGYQKCEEEEEEDVEEAGCPCSGCVEEERSEEVSTADQSVCLISED